jgi:hypothetical protein
LDFSPSQLYRPVAFRALHFCTSALRFMFRALNLVHFSASLASAAFIFASLSPISITAPTLNPCKPPPPFHFAFQRDEARLAALRCRPSTHENRLMARAKPRLSIDSPIPFASKPPKNRSLLLSCWLFFWRIDFSMSMRRRMRSGETRESGEREVTSKKMLSIGKFAFIPSELVRGV